MSFASEVKAELCREELQRDCCRFAELYGAVLASAAVRPGELVLDTENEWVAGRICQLFSLVFGADAQVGQKSRKSHVCRVSVTGEAVEALLDRMYLRRTGSALLSYRVNDALIRSECCLRSFLRGVFLSAGFLSDPNKAYHLEIVTRHRKLCEDLQRLFGRFDIRLKQTERKSTPVLYLKESEAIADAISLFGAYHSLMEFRNAQVLKDVRNHVNRVVNCETANVTKTVNAAADQLRDIQLIEEKMGLSSLPDELQELCTLRMQNPDATLAELGRQLRAPISKSGVNHRFQKLGRIARDLSNPSDPA